MPFKVDDIISEASFDSFERCWEFVCSCIAFFFYVCVFLALPLNVCICSLLQFLLFGYESGLALVTLMLFIAHITLGCELKLLRCW